MSVKYAVLSASVILICMLVTGCIKEKNKDTDISSDISETINTENAGETNNDSLSEKNDLNNELFKVTVSEDKYFYNNREIDLDELINKIESCNTEIVVEISDDNATQKAYKNLTEQLDKSSVKYINK